MEMLQWLDSWPLCHQCFCSNQDGTFSITFLMSLDGFVIVWLLIRMVFIRSWDWNGKKISFFALLWILFLETMNRISWSGYHKSIYHLTNFVVTRNHKTSERNGLHYLCIKPQNWEYMDYKHPSIVYRIGLCVWREMWAMDWTKTVCAAVQPLLIFCWDQSKLTMYAYHSWILNQDAIAEYDL